MAQIPQYISRREPTAEAPAVTRRAENAEVLADTDIYRNTAGEQAGKQLTELSEKIRKVQNSNDLSAATIQITGDLATLETKVDQSDPVHALDNIDKDLQTIGDNAAKKFSDSAAQREFLQDWELKSVSAKIALKSKVMKKIVDIGRTNTLTQLDMESSNYINADSDVEMLDSLKRMDEIVKNAISLQLFTHEQGYDELNKVISAADKAREDVKELQKRKQKELAFLAKEAVNAREEQYIQDRVNGQIPREELIKSARLDMNAEKISPKFAEAYINALKSPKVMEKKLKEEKQKEVTKSTAFKKIAEQIINEDKTPEETRVDLLTKNSTSEISDEEFNILHTFNQSLKEKDVEKAMNKKSFFQRIKNWDWGSEGEKSREEVVSDLFKRYMQRVNAGESPETAYTEVIKTQLDSELAKQSLSPARKYLINKKTNQRIYSDDGGITWYDEKTGEKIK